MSNDNFDHPHLSLKLQYQEARKPSLWSTLVWKWRGWRIRRVLARLQK